MNKLDLNLLILYLLLQNYHIHNLKEKEMIYFILQKLI